MTVSLLSLGIYCWVWWWKNFENRSTLAKLWVRVGCPFLWLTGYMAILVWPCFWMDMGQGLCSFIWACFSNRQTL